MSEYQVQRTKMSPFHMYSSSFRAYEALRGGVMRIDAPAP